MTIGNALKKEEEKHLLGRKKLSSETKSSPYLGIILK
jgi:hypothetical protein